MGGGLEKIVIFLLAGGVRCKFSTSNEHTAHLPTLLQAKGSFTRSQCAGVSASLARDVYTRPIMFDVFWSVVRAGDEEDN